jgi:polar amino acid transport system substrate-binding protein
MAATSQACAWVTLLLIVLVGRAAHSETVANPEMVKEGNSLFNQTCAHCHGPDAKIGLPERNLRNLRARYGAEMGSVYQTTVHNGRPEKGMPAWNEVLDKDTIDQIYIYLETVQEGAQ